MLHLNLPFPKDGITKKPLRELRWMLLGLLAPELPMLFAFAQRASARKSMDEMNKIGHRGWSLTHGFFDDSVYLVKERYMEIPTITMLEIKDKSKANTAAKALGPNVEVNGLLRPGD
ncbi:hypothetical protein F5883DRAFT_673722 [Diaporthe sp. PMI_573]|nr:hypothetical protein F5883DRAFT_673722 [Diaporthaceae sp. PMI_573]